MRGADDAVAATGVALGTAGSGGGFACSCFWSFDANAESWWTRAAYAASFDCRAADPRPVVRATATAPKTAAPARSNAIAVT